MRRSPLMGFAALYPSYATTLLRYYATTLLRYYATTFHGTLRHQILHCSILVAPLNAVLSDLLHQRRVGDRVEHRVGASGVDMSSPQKVRHHENVIALPREAPAGNFGRA